MTRRYHSQLDALTMPTRRRTAILCVPCALLLFCWLAAPQASGQAISGNTISGKIRQSSGQPAANLLIHLETGNGVPIIQTVTGNEGDYAFSGLEGATFIIVINEPHYQPVAERVEFAREAVGRPGETLRVDITLVAKAASGVPPARAVFRQDVPAEALQAYQRGVKLLAERKSDEGMQILAAAIKLYANYFDAHFALGLELLRLRRYDDAIGELERARVINPKDSRVYHTFGIVLFEQKKYALAAAVFAAAVQLNPSDAEAQLMRGAALIEVGHLDEAEAALLNAEQISAHKLAIVHLHLARVYEKRGARARAAEALEQYLKLAPDVKNAEAIREAIKKLRSPAEAKRP
jgi:Putative Zn-dependent protease, contains TPR repeats